MECQLRLAHQNWSSSDGLHETKRLYVWTSNSSLSALRKGTVRQYGFITRLSHRVLQPNSSDNWLKLYIVRRWIWRADRRTCNRKKYREWCYLCWDQWTLSLYDIFPSWSKSMLRLVPWIRFSISVCRTPVGIQPYIVISSLKFVIWDNSN